jgi:antitoxin component HigA of HigAB toxin-antitoxin module
MSIGISSSYDEPDWSTFDEGYRQAIDDITKYIQEEKEYYAEGVMCSMAESTIGENVCDDILEYLKEMRGKEK